MRDEQLDQMIRDAFESSPRYATAYALLRIAEEIGGLATHVKYLGTGNAATQQGALELVAQELRDGFDRLQSITVNIENNE